MPVSIDGLDTGRLRRAEQESRRSWASFRNKRTATLAAVAGDSYGAADAWGEPRDIPKLRRIQETYEELLVPTRPQCQLTTSLRQFMPSAYANELNTNRYLRDVKFERKLRRLVRDALYGVGIAKVTLQEGPVRTRAGMVNGYVPKLDAISFNNFTCDTTALVIDDCEYYGHYELVDLEWAQTNPEFDPETRARLTQVRSYSQRVDGERNAQFLGDDLPDKQETSRDKCEILELFHKPTGLIITFNGEADSEDVLAVRPWAGRANGPYHFLLFSELSDNVAPLGFIQSLFMLDEFIQTMWAKVTGQALRQKRNTFVRGSASADATRVIDAPDGEYTRVDNPDAMREVGTGGYAPENFVILMQALSMLNSVAGNPDALAGLQPQSDTATQDKLLYGAATAHTQTMQRLVTEFATGIVDDIAFYLYTDPVAIYQVDKQYAPGMGATIQVEIGPEQRKDAWESYQIHCEIYSAPPQSPSQKAAKIGAFLSQLILPLMPLMQQQGMMIDAQGLIRTMAKLLGLSDELSNIVIFGAPNDPYQQQAGNQQASTKPAATTRKYERINRTPGKENGQQGADQPFDTNQIMQSMMQSAMRSRPAA